MTKNYKKAIPSIFFLITLLLIPQVISLATAQTAASPDSWTSKAPLPTSGGSYGAAVVNGTIYVIGSPNSGNSKTYAYNPNTDTWTTKAPMPTPRSYFAIAACNNKIYVIGGTEDNTGSSSSANEVYDPSTDTWSTAASMLTARSQMQANTVNGKIYVMGGRTSAAYSTVNITELYDPNDNKWTTGASMLYPVVSYASAVVDNKVYVIGGQDEYLLSGSDNLAVNFTQIYDTATNAWTLGSSIPTSAQQAGAGATTGALASKRIYVIGGMTGFGEGSNQNYVYDPSANTWTNATPIPTACYNPAVAVVNDVLYIIGGGENGNVLATNEQFTPIGYNQIISSSSPSAQPTSQPSNQTHLIEYIGLIAGIVALIAVAIAYIFIKRTKTNVKK